MNKQRLYYYINNPKELNESSLSDIQELVDEYPFFQTARLLLLKNLHQLEHVRFEPELKRSVLYVPDRTRLFELINNLYPAEITGFVPDGKRVEIQEEEKVDNKEKTSSVDITGKVESVGDYFGIEGVSESGQRGAVDFTFQMNENSIPEDQDIPEEQLFDYEKPGGLEYSLNIYKHSLNVDQSRSFSDWLSAIGHHSAGDEVKDKIVKGGKNNKTASIINDFLSSQKAGDKRSKPAVTATSKEIKEESTFDNDDLMTETLANIYIKQGHYDKAINIFEKLSLKYPEKSVYFAQQIKKVEKVIDN